MASGCVILRLRGLPYSASEKDLRDFFEEFDVVATHISLRNGKPTGEAYVQFGSSEEAARALKKRNHEHMGSRYIEIFESLEAGLVAKSLAPAGSGIVAAAPSLRGEVVRLRGLPFASTAQDVLHFFDGIEVVGGEAGVIFTCTPDGRPAGEAYVEVASAEDKEAALVKHKEKIGSRYIEIFDSSKGDMYQAVQQHGCFTAVGGKRRHHWPAGGAGAHGALHAAQQSGGGQYGGDMGLQGRGRGQQGHGVEDMTAAFAGVPPHWRPAAQPAPGPPHPGSRPQHFSRAPGPPPGKGSTSAAGGVRPHQGGSGGLFEYGGATPPLMMQAPFMLQPPPFMHPQQPGSPWAAAMMAASAQQQGGAWYGPGMAGPQARGGPVPMGMAGPYTAFGPGFYMRSPGMSPPPPHMVTPSAAMPLPGLPVHARTPPPPGAPQPPQPPQPSAAGAALGGSALAGGSQGGALLGASRGGGAAAPLALPASEEDAGSPQLSGAQGAAVSGGIGGRGDSSHSLSGMMNSAASRSDSGPPS
ncbi:hypothetical protein N2152v2_007509 [Parachlorella kessleri]